MNIRKLALTTTLAFMTIGISGCETLKSQPASIEQFDKASAVKIKVLRELTKDEMRRVEAEKISEGRKISVYVGNQIQPRMRISQRLLHNLQMAGHFDLIRLWGVDPFCPNC